jgi:hypothetical protein
MVGRAPTHATEKPEYTSIGQAPPRRNAWSRGSIAALILLGLFLVSYVALILKWEDFAYSDNDMFTLFTLRGHNIDLPIWKGEGRFFPLGHQEFNLIRHFTSTVAGYHALPIIQLLIVCCILLILDDKLSITARAALAAFVLITPGIVVSFGGLIFSERNVVLWLVCLAFFVKRFEQTFSPAWAAAAAVSAQIMIYYKETGFVLLLGFAAARLALRCWNSAQGTWDFTRLRTKESCLDLCLACLGVVFLLYYAAVMFPHPSMKYADEERLTTIEVLLSYIKLDLLAWLLMAVVLGRTYLILRRKALASPLWDGLALGGLAYFAAYLHLRMFTDYFLAPVDVIAVLYVGRFATLSWRGAQWWGKTAGLVFLFVILLQDVSLSAFSVFERKNVIHAKAEIASLIDSRGQSGPGNVKRIFFPFANPYRVMEFAAYLNYRGVPLEGAEGSAGLNSVAVVAKSVANEGPCVDWRTLVCQPGSRPEPGDLVVMLPDDNASLEEVSPYRDEGELLFSYEPLPRIPLWLYPLLRRLHIASTPFPLTSPPNHWLQASVTLWK